MKFETCLIHIYSPELALYTPIVTDQQITPLASATAALFPEPTKATKLERCDFAHFAATWWPLAGFNLPVPLGSPKGVFEAVEQYRRETIHFVAQCLDLELTKDSLYSEEMSFFMMMSQVEQKAKPKGVRMGTSAVGMICAVIDDHDMI
ncbi:uncharacterized protein BDW43DRAFT_296510 [Aspergillus alliaceus]|uniref:uncharacterized protein n=1 Tax=Petromyces alliaceus TaxID=209559 RepID=UPI0012A600CA|nr:uncharacterized protein BDW43DRAFT_296510 [Aspergillus alliaceus]KAB8239190.1 hypothetical protein BDW43DRAFT_296510 [Aspergillus alliaceus]